MQTNLRTDIPTRNPFVKPEAAKPQALPAGAAVLAEPLSAADAKSVIKQADVKQLQRLLQTADFVEPEESPLSAEAAEEQAAAARAASRIRRAASGVVDNASRTAVAELVAGGLRLEKIDLQLLSDIMNEIETDPAIETADEAYARESAAALTRKHGLSPALNAAMEDYAVVLAAAGAAVTVKNLLAMVNADAMHARLGNLADAAVVSVLQADAPLTLEHVYTTRFSVPALKDMPDADWAQLEPAVRKSLAHADVPASADDLRMARLLLSNDAGATAENIESAKLLQTLGEAPSRGEILARAAKQLADGKPAASLLLSAQKAQAADGQNVLRAENAAIADALPHITAAHIDIALIQSLPITLGALRGLWAGNTQNAPSAQPPGAAQAIQYKRSLAELQAKLTFDAANRLASKGFRLETAGLEESLAALRTLEQETAAKTLRQAAAPETPQNVERLAGLIDQLQRLRAMPAPAYRPMRAEGGALTIETAARHAALASYELAATPVSAKHGDSFNALAEQFAPFVESLGLQATAENLRAARTLSRGGMDVTAEAILEARGLNAKLESVAARLHPFLAARLLKDGVNVSALPLDDVIARIEQFEEEYGATDADKIADHLAALDRQKTLAPTEREALIAVYRALHKAQKQDNAALGAAIRVGRALTLANLSETADAFRMAGQRFSAVDVSLADDESTRNASLHAETAYLRAEAASGKAQAAPMQTGTASGQAEGASTHAEAETLQAETAPLQETAAFIARHEISRVIRHAAPAPLRDLLGENGREWPLSDAADFMAARPQAIEGNVREMLAEAGRLPAEAAAFLQRSGLPLTLPNLASFRRLLQQPESFAEVLDEDETKEALGALLPDDALPVLEKNETPGDWLNRMAAHLEVQSEAEPARFDEAVRMLRLQSAIAQAARSYYIPVNRNGKTADVHIYALNENADEQNAVLMLSLRTAFGRVQIRGAVADGVLALAVQAGEAGIEMLRANTALLARAADELQCELQINFKASEAESVANTRGGRLARTIHERHGEMPKGLYALATTLLQFITAAETDFGNH